MTRAEFDAIFEKCKKKYLPTNQAEIQKKLSTFADQDGKVSPQALAIFSFIETVQFTAKDALYGLELEFHMRWSASIVSFEIETSSASPLCASEPLNTPLSMAGLSRSACTARPRIRYSSSARFVTGALEWAVTRYVSLSCKGAIRCVLRPSCINPCRPSALSSKWSRWTVS